MVPTLISAYTVSNLLHLYAALKRTRDAGFRRPKRVVFAAATGAQTCALFNVLTTAAGMISLVLVPIPPIQTFGLIAAAGAIIIYLVVFYLVPPFLVKFDRGPWPQRSGGSRGPSACRARWPTSVSATRVGWWVRSRCWGWRRRRWCLRCRPNPTC
jgi:Predicted exporters of the RND superfamily